MRKFIVICVTVLSSICVQAQAYVDTDSVKISTTEDYITYLTKIVPYQGIVTIKQSADISELMQKRILSNIQAENKIVGWRVQVYNSSGQNSRKEAQDMRQKFTSNFPNIATYQIYQAPFFKIRVGDFRTREEAFMLYKQIQHMFPAAYLVKDKIQLPKF